MCSELVCERQGYRKRLDKQYREHRDTTPNARNNALRCCERCSPCVHALLTPPTGDSPKIHWNPVDPVTPLPHFLKLLRRSPNARNTLPNSAKRTEHCLISPCPLFSKPGCPGSLVSFPASRPFDSFYLFTFFTFYFLSILEISILSLIQT